MAKVNEFQDLGRPVYLTKYGDHAGDRECQS